VQIERISIALRPRAAGEALDLGLAMLREWARPLLTAWLLCVVPVQLACLALGGPRSFWTYFAWWWLAPMLERPLTFVLSRAVFGAAPSARELLRELPRLWSRHALRGLLLNRIDPMRAVVQPTALLEGLRGAALRRRETLLRGGQLGACLMLMKAAASFELVVFSSLLVGIYFVLPSAQIGELEELGAWLTEPGAGPENIFVGAFFIMFGFGYLVRASAGFALYLNRRTELEGWDLEIALRLLARRAATVVDRPVEPPTAGAAILLVAPLLAGLACFGFSVPVAAQQVESPEPNASTAADPVALTEEILRGPEFERTVMVRRWFDSEPDEPDATLSFFGDALGPLFELLLWGLLLAALGLIVWWLVVRAPGVVAQAARESAPAEVFGLDIRPESLPADVVASAREVWRRGDARGALSLLYRGAIARLVHGSGLEIESGDTEQDCVARTRARTAPELAAYFADLTRAWTSVAWSHEPVREAGFAELCEGWRRVFEQRGTAP